MYHKRYAIVGAGNIGSILVERLFEAGVYASQIGVCDPNTEKTDLLMARFGVQPGALDNPAIFCADVLLISVGPAAVLDVVRQLVPYLHPGQLILSFAAAVPAAQIEALVPAGVSVARVMPNPPSMVGKGMNPVAYGQSVTVEARALTEMLLAKLGMSVEVRDDQMNWAVGLAGAAMRSVLPVLEGMTQAGIEAGLTEAMARRVAAGILRGVAALALETDLRFDEIKKLTPMQTVDEAALAQIFVEAARSTKVKIDGLQKKVLEIS